MLRETGLDRIDVAPATPTLMQRWAMPTVLSLTAEGKRASAHWLLSMALMRTPQNEIAPLLEKLATTLDVPLRREGRDAPLLDWDQLREWRRRGFDLGGHGANHVNLGLADAAEVEREVMRSFERIAAETGSEVGLFAYPYGGPEHRNSAAVEALRKAGCRAAFTTEPGVVLPGGDRYALPRLSYTRAASFACAHQTEMAFQASAPASDAAPGAKVGTQQREFRWNLALWLAAATAFSPVLVDLASSLRETDASWSILLAPVLLLLCVLRGPRRVARPAPDGRILLASALILEVLGIASGSWSIARLGLPFAVIGLSRLVGRPPLLVALLSFGAVPPPTSILHLTTPWAESAFAAFAALVGSAMGAPLAASGPLLRDPDAQLELAFNHSGLPLAVVLAQLGWYAAIRRGRGARGTVAGALVGGALAVPLQALGVLVAAMALWSGQPAWGRIWLDWGMGVLCAVAMVTWVEVGCRWRATDRG
jgi:hypothetical protein